MVDLDLIEYLNGGRCLAFIGSGPSCEVGLLDWRGLAEKLLLKVREKAPPDLDSYDILFAQEKYPELFDRAWRKLSPSFVLNSCKAVLVDTNRTGTTYQFLAGFDFLGYLTTNFDSILKRHILGRGDAVQEYSNRKTDIERVDFESVSSIVKLHGDLDNADTVVLTDSQYDKFIHDPSWKYLRVFLTSYLTTARMLFVGYSIRDPCSAPR
jgi:hypothetical protein